MSAIGLYAVRSRLFKSKVEAYVHASSHNIPTSEIKYHFCDEAWKAAIKQFTYNPNISLNVYYVNRAKQLRDRFDYLILYFSGGADSTTILDTFLKNNIKLDEVFVKWPKNVKYIPDNINKTPFNMVSEWDYSIKPKLDRLRETHPEIKIVVGDWTDNLHNININHSLLEVQNHNFGLPNFGQSEMVSPSSHDLEGKGVKVGHIFGIDKPNIVYDSVDNVYSMLFTELPFMALFQHAFGTADLDNRINFYYAVDYPEIHLARCYAVASTLDRFPRIRSLIDVRLRLNEEEKQRAKFKFDDICNAVCYPDWDRNTFQVDKPSNTNKFFNPWYFYIYQAEEFKTKLVTLTSTLNDVGTDIRDDLKSVDSIGNVVGLRYATTNLMNLKRLAL